MWYDKRLLTKFKAQWSCKNVVVNGTTLWEYYCVSAYAFLLGAPVDFPHVFNFSDMLGKSTRARVRIKKKTTNLSTTIFFQHDACTFFRSRCTRIGTARCAGNKLRGWIHALFLLLYAVAATCDARYYT